MIGCLVMAVIHFTLPSFNSAGGCEEGLIPLADMAEVRLYGQPQWGRDTLLALHPATAPGAADSFAVVPPDERIWVCWVTTADVNGNESCPSNHYRLNGTVGVGEEAVDWLANPLPNPARESVKIVWHSSQQVACRVEAFDTAGRLIAKIHSGASTPGRNEAIWDASRYGPGVYAIRLTAGNFQASKRVVLVR